MSDSSTATSVSGPAAGGEVRLLRYPRDTVVLMVAVVTVIGVTWALFGYANYYEFAHFGEIARNMAEGKGFVSYSTQPAALAFFHERGLGGPPWPVAERFIAYPALLSLVFRVFGVHDGVILGFNAVVFAGLVGLLFQTGVRLFDRPTAWLACAIFVLNPVFTFNYALYGFLDPLFTLVVWSFSLCLLRLAETDRPLRWALLIGLLYGAGYLVRYSALTLAPLYALLVAWLARTRRGPTAAVFVLGVLVGVVALLGYNLVTFGMPGTYLTSSWVMAEHAVSEGEPWRRYATYSTWEILATSWDAVLAKFSKNLTTSVLSDVTKLHNLQLLIPFAVYGFFAADAPRQRRLLAIVGIPLVAQLLVFALSHPELATTLRWTDRYYFWGALIVLLFGSWGLRALVLRLRHGRAWLALLLALLLVSFRVWWRPAARFDVDGFPARDYLLHEVPRDAVIATNAWHNSITFYFGHPTIELPVDPDVIGDIQRDWTVDVILLNVDSVAARALAGRWAAMIASGTLDTDFGKRHAFSFDRAFTDAEGNLQVIALRSTRTRPAAR